MESFVKYRNLALLFIIILFSGITFVIKGFFLDEYIKEIENIGGRWGEKYSEGKLDAANDDLNTAKILSDGSLNTVYTVFQNSLQKGRKQEASNDKFQKNIDKAITDLGIKRNKYQVGSPSKIKNNLQFKDYSYEFTCNYLELTNLLSILEGHENLFKIDKLSIKNPISNYKNKEKPNEVNIALTLSTVTLKHGNSNKKESK